MTVARAGSLCRHIWSISDGCDKSQVKRDAGLAIGLASRRSLPLVPGGPARSTSRCTRSRSKHHQWPRAWVFSRTWRVPPQPCPPLPLPAALLNVPCSRMLLPQGYLASKPTCSLPASFQNPGMRFSSLLFFTSAVDVFDCVACRGNPTILPVRSTKLNLIGNKN